jgi:hypothetical protein
VISDDILEGIRVDEETVLPVPDNRVHISFADEADAEVFKEWLFIFGFAIFKKHLDDIEEED